MQNLKNEEIRQAVRESYGKIAKSDAAECGCGCGSEDNPSAQDLSVSLGYSRDDVSSVPEGANMGLGCGNPHAIASLKPGETVLDLGSGGGFDCFLASRAVGDRGHVIGVDMTPDMVSKARANAASAEVDNMEFRLGEIENIPAADNSVDAIISNCVINLSPEKEKVYKEAFRVMKRGGRLAITDVVATGQLPDEVKRNLDLHTGCLSGASLIEDLQAMLEVSGFNDIRIKPLDGSKELIRKWTSESKIDNFVVSATVEAVKP